MLSRRRLLRVFLLTVRWLQRHAGWLHLPFCDRLIVKVWRYLLELDQD